jgi:hypothetical protein
MKTIDYAFFGIQGLRFIMSVIYEIVASTM